ncbi:MAG: hypothetical protein AAF335_03800 [Bacteroidota bacterium]
MRRKEKSNKLLYVSILIEAHSTMLDIQRYYAGVESEPLNQGETLDRLLVDYRDILKSQGKIK